MFDFFAAIQEVNGGLIFENCLPLGVGYVSRHVLRHVRCRTRRTSEGRIARSMTKASVQLGQVPGDLEEPIGIGNRMKYPQTQRDSPASEARMLDREDRIPIDAIEGRFERCQEGVPTCREVKYTIGCRLTIRPEGVETTGAFCYEELGACAEMGDEMSPVVLWIQLEASGQVGVIVE